MNTLLLFVVVYIAYLVIWLIINTIIYFLAVAMKSSVLVNILMGIGTVGIYIFNFILGIGLLVFTFSLLLNGEILWFIVMIFFGMGLISGLLSYLQMPFLFVSGYFSEKIEKTDFKSDVVTGEILDEHNKVVGKVEGDTTISVRLARYFVAFYIFNLLSILTSSQPYPVGALDWITKPFFQIASSTLIFGIPYIIYHKIRHKTFFPEDKRYFFIKVWKICLYIFIPLWILLLALGALFIGS